MYMYVRGCVCPCVCDCMCVCVCVRTSAWMRACSACNRVCVCGLSASAFEGVRVSLLLRGALRMLSWYLRDTKGTRRVLEGTRRALKAYSCFCQVVL